MNLSPIVAFAENDQITGHCLVQPLFWCNRQIQALTDHSSNLAKRIFLAVAAIIIYPMAAISCIVGLAVKLITIIYSNGTMPDLKEWCNEKQGTSEYAKRVEAAGKIRSCRYWKGRSLNLQGLGLSSLPQSIGTLAQLLTLDLSSNRFQIVPESIGNLTQLKNLNISNSQLVLIPQFTLKLPHLTTLDLSNNNLQSLPTELAQLPMSCTVDVRRNRISPRTIQIFQAAVAARQTTHQGPQLVFSTPKYPPPLPFAIYKASRPPQQLEPITETSESSER